MTVSCFCLFGYLFLRTHTLLTWTSIRLNNRKDYWPAVASRLRHKAQGLHSVTGAMSPLSGRLMVLQQ